jgi:glycosyl hydrolase family 25
MEVLHFPDVYSGDFGINFGSSYVVVAKATQGIHYVDPYYQNYQAQAKAESTYFMGYHFLEKGNVIQQAQAAFKVVGSRVPLALDCESYLSSRPDIVDVCEFLDEYTSLGGLCYITYLPHWYWQSVLNSPDLGELYARHQWLWSSNYTVYSDTGPGWEGYGGLPVAMWQYADNVPYGGKPAVDFSAFKGTGSQASLAGLLGEFAHLVTTGVLSKNVAPMVLLPDRYRIVIQIRGHGHGLRPCPPGTMLITRRKTEATS